jgi:signal transduction histidine kinase
LKLLKKAEKNFPLNSPWQPGKLRKQEEEALRDTQAQLYQSEKLSTLGKLSAGIAHELNNPVASAKRSSVQLQKVFIELQRFYLKMSKYDFTEEQISVLVEIAQVARDLSENPLQMDASKRSDREHEIEQWLNGVSVSNAWEIASPLVSLGYNPKKLAIILKQFPAPQFSSVINWQCAIYTIYSLLSEIALGTSRVADITHAFKSYTYMDQAPVQKVDIEKDLENTLIIFKSKMKDKITIERDYKQDLPKIEAYGSELNQVWTNLIDNAIDAMGERGILSLKTRKDGSCVVIEIEDNGPGIPENIQAKVFDPFFTTKKVGTGSGLGLSISQNIIVKRHSGHISITTRPGKTTFTVRLPLVVNTTSEEAKD